MSPEQGRNKLTQQYLGRVVTRDYLIKKGAGPGVVLVESSRDPYTDNAAPVPLSVSGGHARRAAAGPYEWPDDETAHYYHVDHHTRKQELT